MVRKVEWPGNRALRGLNSLDVPFAPAPATYFRFFPEFGHLEHVGQNQFQRDEP